VVAVEGDAEVVAVAALVVKLKVADVHREPQVQPPAPGGPAIVVQLVIGNNIIQLATGGLPAIVVHRPVDRYPLARHDLTILSTSVKCPRAMQVWHQPRRGGLSRLRRTTRSCWWHVSTEDHQFWQARLVQRKGRKVRRKREVEGAQSFEMEGAS